MSKLSHMNELKGFPSIDLEATCLLTNQKFHVVYPRNFFVRVSITWEKPGHHRSRPQMTLETFNLSATTAEKLLQEVQGNIDNNTRNNETQEATYAKY
jgi:hypothetical protein